MAAMLARWSFHRILLVWIVSLASAGAAAFEYDGRSSLPQEATPSWAFVFKQGSAQTGSEGLRVEATDGQRHLYAIGQSHQGKPWGEPSVWDMSAGFIQVTFRLRCEARDPELEVFRLIIRDGTQQWQVPITAASVYRKPLDTTEWDTYTAVVENGKLRVSSERHGLIVENRKAQPGERGNGLLFGSYFFRKNDSAKPRAWELAFLRCSNEPFTSPNR